MSVAGSAEPGSKRGGTRWLTIWVPAVVVVVALLGALAVVPSVQRDSNVQPYYRGLVGGSPLFALDTVAARFMPFVIAAAIAVAVLQRQIARRRRTVSPESIKRHEWSEIATHWLNAVGIGIGLLTAAWFLRWLPGSGVATGRETTFSLYVAYIMHFVGSALVLGTVSYHLAYEIAGGGTGLLPRSRADVKNAVAEAVGYTGVYRGLPGVFGVQLPLRIRLPAQRVLRRVNLAPDPSGKYLATEKVFSYPIWALLVGIVVLTGIIKLLAYVYPLPSGLRQFVTFLHDGATIWLVLLLIFHVAALVLVPRNWPLLKSMFTSRISRRYAAEHLPEWPEAAEQE